MALKIWLPLNGNFDNQGLSSSTITTDGVTLNNNGKIGKCYYFDGHGYIKGDNSPLNNSTPDWSFACWIKFNNLSNSDCLFSNRTEVDIKGISIFKQYNQILFDDGDRWTCTPSITINANEWIHLCFTRQKGVCKKIYINGILSDTQNIYSYDPVYADSNYFSFGAKQQHDGEIHTAENLLYGYMNDIRIYDHCLSAKEVKEISKGLIAHYTLNNSMAGQENLLIGTSMTANERTIHPLSGNAPVVATDYFRCYNGSVGLHSFYEDIDEITLNEASNLGIAFQRKATDINLDTSSYYTLFCEAKCNRPDAKLSIARSYMNNSGKWIWRGGELQQSFNNTTDWQKFKLTFIPDADTQYISYNFTVPTTSASTDYKFLIRHCKLEKGTEATPYTLNREDADYTKLGLDSGIEYDCGGYGYNGTKYNTAIADKYNRYLNSTKFTRSLASYINCGTARAGSIRDQITISFWAYRDNWDSNNTETFLSCTEAGGYSFGIHSSSSTGRIITFYMGSGASTSNTYIIINIENNLTSGWHLFTGTYDGYGTKCYIDGELAGTNDYYSTKTPIFYNTNIPLLIGCEPYGASSTGDNFDGNISDIRIYATALSTDDVKELYEQSAFIDNKGNIGCYEFIET